VVKESFSRPSPLLDRSGSLRQFPWMALFFFHLVSFSPRPRSSRCLFSPRMLSSLPPKIPFLTLFVFFFSLLFSSSPLFPPRPILQATWALALFPVIHRVFSSFHPPLRLLLFNLFWSKGPRITSRLIVPHSTLFFILHFCL